jgi:hypothetical protein
MLQYRAEGWSARIESCEIHKLIVGRTPMSLGLNNFDLPFGELSRNHDVALRPRRWQCVDGLHPPNSLDAEAGKFQ